MSSSQHFDHAERFGTAEPEVSAAVYWNRLDLAERARIIASVEPNNIMATYNANLPLILQSWQVRLAVENLAGRP